jgi:quercetin dioxygenase-like cupin family protein
MAGRALAVGAGEGEAVWFLRNRTEVKVGAEETGGAYGLVESIVPAGWSPPLHVHRREDEAFYVLEGEFTFRCGDETFSGGPGTYVFLPRDVPHTFVAEGDEPGRLLTLVSPGGGERFFVEAARPAEDDGLPPAGPIDVARLQQVAERFGNEIVGPPLAPRGAAALRA